MPAAKIQAKKSRNSDPQTYTPKAGQAPATVLCNTNYFGIYRKMAKTYYEAQMIGGIFLSNQPSVTGYRRSRHVQYISLPQYATGISSRPRQSAFHHKPPTETYNARHSVVPRTP